MSTTGVVSLQPRIRTISQDLKSVKRILEHSKAQHGHGTFVEQEQGERELQNVGHV